MTIIPETITPKELAQETGWSERFVRETARALNACLGRNRGMRLTEADVLAIMESRRHPPSRSNGGAMAAGKLPDGDYETLVRMRLEKPKRRVLPPSLPGDHRDDQSRTRNARTRER